VPTTLSQAASVSVDSPAPMQVLLLPGWHNSGPAHWQSQWERLHGYRRVQQNDWLWPRRGDWMARLDEALLENAPGKAATVLVAHSLGCHLVAAWAAHTHHASCIRAALLVAPPDTERDDTPPQLFNWRPLMRQPLPFASTVVASSNDPYCDAVRAASMAADWGSAWCLLGAHGHLNDQSGLGAWAQGHALLQSLIASTAIGAA
jgi:uncharacterized protein